MADIFLPDLDNSKAGGLYAQSIKSLRSAGKEIPGIMHLLAFKPKATDFLNQFTQEVMRGESPLSPAFREMIATITSEGNECSVCRDSHGEAAAWTLLEFIVQVNLKAQEIEEPDIRKLRKAGWSDEAIYDAITVCSLFNFYNRWVGASGVAWKDEDSSQASGARIAQRGYIP